MSRTRVKICGITRPDDVRLAARLGADAIGLVFYESSRRVVTPTQAAVIRQVTPVFVSLVGLFVNPTREQVRNTLKQVHLDCLQFHGEETPEFCASFGVPYMKAVRVRSGAGERVDAEHDPLVIAAAHNAASAILLDAYDPQQAGGTGQRFDWSVARQCVAECSQPVVLAGGLNATNAAQAIQEVQPWALDLSSGVESEPGIKDPEKMQVFFNEVNRVRN